MGSEFPDLVAALPDNLPLPVPLVANDELPTVRRVLTRLLRERGQPYFPWMVAGALASLSCVAARTVETSVGIVARGLARLFDGLVIAQLSDYQPQVHVAAAAAGHIPGLTPSMVVGFIDACRALQRALDDWLTLNPDSRPLWAGYQVPRLADARRLRRHLRRAHSLSPGQQALEERRDGLMQIYDDLPRLARDRVRFLEHVDAAAQGGAGICSVEGLEAVHRFRFWKAFLPGRVAVIGEYLGASGGNEAWFLALIRNRLLTRPGPHSPAAAWLRSQALPRSYLASSVAGVLRPDRFERMAVTEAVRRAEGTCFALAPLLMAARFGEFTLAMLSAHTSSRCPRISELQQLALDALRVGPAGVWYYRARVKGGTYEDIPISAEAAHAAIALADALRRAYRLPADARLPSVVPHTLSVPAPPAEYLFQFGGRFMDARSLNACLRFLLFGLAADGGLELRLHAHLFRHGYANSCLQAGEPVASVADALTHADLETTRRRYGYPTRSQACASAQRRRT